MVRGAHPVEGVLGLASLEDAHLVRVTVRARVRVTVRARARVSVRVGLGLGLGLGFGFGLGWDAHGKVARDVQTPNLPLTYP